MKASVEKFLGSPCAVVCHDAGAANLIISWLRGINVIKFRVHMKGPAAQLWKTSFSCAPIVSLSEALDGAEHLLSGTGWSSQLEHEARHIARAHNIPTIAVIDHWVNYRERFIRNDLEVLPDEIWVSDNAAFIEAKRCFPNLVVREFTNEFLRDQVTLIHMLDFQSLETKNNRVLYVLEPIRHCWSGRDSRLGEFQALDYFISRLSCLGLNSKTEIRLRPHPSDPPGKYNAWLRSHKSAYNVSLAPVEPLAQAVSWAGLVAGCETFALVIALSAGRKVVSTLPPWGHACKLPHPDLIHLSHL